jgi:hypothetical protein
MNRHRHRDRVVAAALELMSVRGWIATVFVIVGTRDVDET